MSDYPKHYHRALNYSADEAGASHLLSPESLTDADRHGGPEADHTKRGVIADYLQDLGRDAEAALLRSGRHVLIEGGTVKPGRFTERQLAQRVRAVREWMTRMSGDDNAPWEVRPSTDPAKVEFHHPDHEQPEVYPHTEGRSRITTTLRLIAGLHPATGDWANGWTEEVADAPWKRLRRLVNAVADSPVEEVDPTHKQEERP